MPVLVVDSCALVHLKQAHSALGSGLLLVEHLCTAGLGLASTARVHQENEQQTLRPWLAVREAAGVYVLLQVSASERKRVRNALTASMPEPGDKDKALIALAARLETPLLTHDGPAAALASRCRVVVVDAIDLAVFAARRGLLTREDAEALVAPLGEHAWRPPSWQGTAAATVAVRPRSDALFARLDLWWAAADSPPPLG